MKLLEIPKMELIAFIREFEKITKDYKNAVNPGVAAVVIHPNLMARMPVAFLNVMGDFTKIRSNNCANRQNVFCTKKEVDLDKQLTYNTIVKQMN